MNISKLNPIITCYDKSFPVYIKNMGISVIQDPIFRPAGIDVHQLLYTAKGKGKTYIYGKKYELEPNTILFHPANTTQLYEQITEDWQTYWITYNGSIDFFERKPAIWHLPENFEFISYFNSIMSYENTPEWGMKSSVILYELLISCREFAAEEQTYVYNLRSRLNPVINFLYEHFAENITISEIAEMIGVSSEHFCKLFKEFTNMRPFEYITHLRIEHAKTLLVEDVNAPIGSIAHAVGYSDNSYFIKRFKELEGMSPGQYRKMLCIDKELSTDDC